MGWDGLTRTTAIGVLFGAFATVTTAWLTPELARAPWKALLLAGPLLLFYAGLGILLGAALVALHTLARRIQVDLRGLLSARLLWGLVVLGGTFVVFNHALRSHVVGDVWKLPGRAVLGTLAAVLLGLALARPGRIRALRIERGLAWGLVPALIVSAIYFGVGRAEAGPGSSVSPGDVIALTPRFETEPAAVLGSARRSQPRRAILIGLDGASWDRIDDGIRAGRLPTFQRLRERGVHAPLETLYPTYSPPIWTSIVTGVPPSAHGIEDFYLTQLTRLDVQNLHLSRGFSSARKFLDRLGELQRVPVTSSLRRRKALWNLADEAGVRSAVLGLWATWPPEPLQHGFVVSDHASLAQRREWLDRKKTHQLTVGATTHPELLAERLAPLQRAPESVTREELAEFLPVDDALWEEFQQVQRFSKRVKLSAFRAAPLGDAFMFSAARKLWHEEQPGLMLVYGNAIDSLSHFFYEASVPEAADLGYEAQHVARYGAVVDRVYAWMDGQIAPLVDAVDEDGNTLLVVASDHGWEKEADGGYNHSYAPPGILILYGAGVCGRDCPTLDRPSVYDVAPTLLMWMGLPISEEIVGRPLTEAFTAAPDVVRVRRYGRVLTEARVISSERDAELNEKLEALGYVR